MHARTIASRGETRKTRLTHSDDSAGGSAVWVEKVQSAYLRLIPCQYLVVLTHGSAEHDGGHAFKVVKPFSVGEFANVDYA